MYRRNLQRLAGCVAAVLMLLTFATPASAASLWDAPAASLGDSFASGEGGLETGPYLAGSDTSTNQCHRSRTSPAQLLGVTPLVNIEVDASCSGATTAHIAQLARYGEPPQATRLHAGIKRTYIMIGGNDLEFGTLLGCYLVFDCEKTAVPALAMQLLAQLPPKLDTAYKAVKTAAPHAQHTVILYPPLVPTGTAPDLSRCPELNTAEVAFAVMLLRGLNQAIRERAAANGFRTADPAPLFRGHDVCSAHPFFYRPGTVAQAGTYHPNLNGRAMLAATASRTF